MDPFHGFANAFQVYFMLSSKFMPHANATVVIGLRLVLSLYLSVCNALTPEDTTGQGQGYQGHRVKVKIIWAKKHEISSRHYLLWQIRRSLTANAVTASPFQPFRYDAACLGRRGQAATCQRRCRQAGCANFNILMWWTLVGGYSGGEKNVYFVCGWRAFDW